MYIIRPPRMFRCLPEMYNNTHVLYTSMVITEVGQGYYGHFSHYFMLDNNNAYVLDKSVLLVEQSFL